MAAPLLRLAVLPSQGQGLRVPSGVGPSERGHRPAISISFVPDGGDSGCGLVVDGYDGYDGAPFLCGSRQTRRRLLLEVEDKKHAIGCKPA